MSGNNDKPLFSPFNLKALEPSNGLPIQRRKTLSFFPRPSGQDNLTAPQPRRSRASLAPSRSILKASNEDNHTITGVMQISVKDDKATSKKFARRRVSFAPEATLHTFRADGQQQLVLPRNFESSGSGAPNKTVADTETEKEAENERAQLASIFAFGLSPAEAPKSPKKKPTLFPFLFDLQNQKPQQKSPPPVETVNPEVSAKPATPQKTAKSKEESDAEEETDTAEIFEAARQQVAAQEADKPKSTSEIPEPPRQDDLISLDSPKPVSRAFSYSSPMKKFSLELDQVIARRQETTPPVDAEPEVELTIEKSTVLAAVLDPGPNQKSLQEEEDDDLNMTQMFGTIMETAEQTVATPIKLAKSVSEFFMTESATKAEEKPDDEEEMDITSIPKKGATPVVLDKPNDSEESDMDFTSVPRAVPIKPQHLEGGESLAESQAQSLSNISIFESAAKMSFSFVRTDMRRKSLAELFGSLQRRTSLGGNKAAQGTEEEDMDLTDIPRKPVSDDEEMDMTEIPRKSVAPAKPQSSFSSDEEMDLTSIPRLRSLESDSDESDDMDFTNIPQKHVEPVESDNESEEMDLTTMPKNIVMVDADDNSVNKTVSKRVSLPAENDEAMDLTDVPRKSSSRDKENKAAPASLERRLVVKRTAETSSTPPKATEDAPHTPKHATSHANTLNHPVEGTPTKPKSVSPAASRKRKFSADAGGRSSAKKQRRQTLPAAGDRVPVSATPPPRQASTVETTPRQAIDLSTGVFTPSKAKILYDKLIELSPQKKPQTASRLDTILNSVRKSPDQASAYILDTFAKTTFTPLRRRPEPEAAPTQEAAAARPQPSVAAAAETIMPLEDFLQLVNISFVDQLLLPNLDKPYSNTAKWQQLTAAGQQNAAERGEPRLVDYAVAKQKLPLWEMYRFGLREMRKDIRSIQGIIGGVEQDVREGTPRLVEYYVRGTADERELLRAKLAATKTYMRTKSRGMWYTWRLDLMAGLFESLEKNRQAILNDRKVLEARVARVVAGAGAESLDGVRAQVAGRHTELRARTEELRRKKAARPVLNAEDAAALRARHGRARARVEQMEASVVRVLGELQDADAAATTLRAERAELEAAVARGEAAVRAGRQNQARDIERLSGKLRALGLVTGVRYVGETGAVVRVMVEESLAMAVTVATGDLALSSGHETGAGHETPCLEFFRAHVLAGVGGGGLDIGQRLSRAALLWSNAGAIDRQLRRLALYAATRQQARADGESLAVTATAFGRAGVAAGGEDDDDDEVKKTRVEIVLAPGDLRDPKSRAGGRLPAIISLIGVLSR